MNRQHSHPPRITRSPAYRQAFQRLDESLGHNSNFSNVEKIRRMRATYFADVDALEKSGKVVLPK
jgi:hypothetical protein